MSTALTVALSFNFLVIVFLLWHLGRMRAELSGLRSRARALDPELAGPPAELDELFKEEQATLMTIEILNAMELASKESWFASIFGSLSPRLVRRKVYDRASRIVRDQLLDFGVQADVRVHRGS